MCNVQRMMHMHMASSREPDMTEPETVAADRANELRTKIRDLIRATRRRLGMSQADLGSALGSNRFLIIRMEKGEREITVGEA